MAYEILTYASGEQVVIRYNENGSTSTIPMKEGNLDYEDYLRWLENEEQA